MVEKKKNVEEKVLITVKDVKGFLSPLVNLSSKINSVIFEEESGSLRVDALSIDKTMICNLVFSKDVVEVNTDEVKIPIFNLPEFLNVIKFFEATENLQLQLKGNKIQILNGSSKFDYVLADPDLIKTAPKGGLKAKFIIDLEMPSDFNKKVKAVAATLGVTTLKIGKSDKKVFIKVCGKSSLGHEFTEIIKTNGTELPEDDFVIALEIDKLGIIQDGVNMTLSVNEKVTKWVNKDFAYYIATQVEG